MNTTYKMAETSVYQEEDESLEGPSLKRFKADDDMAVKSVSNSGTATTTRRRSSDTSTSGTHSVDEDDRDVADADASSTSSASVASVASPARGISLQEIDSEEDALSLDTNDHGVQFNPILRRILAAAAAQGIPLEFLAHIHEAEDDGPVEYPFEETPKSIRDVARFIQSPRCNKILILAGAGMSVASGIPDFRSSNGLYATLQADTLTATQEQRDRIQIDPSYALDQNLFLENPLPCLEVNREFVLGIQSRKWKATLAHRFVELLEEKTGKLCRLYTQNIDGLEDQCGLPHSKRIAVHGSMDEASCAVCHEPMPMDEFCHRLRTQIKDITGRDPTAPKESTPIGCSRCKGPCVKPNIVLFRSSLPKEFFQKVPMDTQNVDLLVIIGTSLGVAPANSLVWRVPKKCMRVLINREPVGWHLGLDFEESKRDFFGRGDCESVILELMEHLGWLEDLRAVLDDLPESSRELLRAALENSPNE